MPDERSLTAVFQDILQNVQEIIRSEVRLAKAEVQEELSKAVSSAWWMIAGAVAAVFALLFAMWGVVYVLALRWPMWGAVLLVAAGLTAAATLLLIGGIRRVKRLHLMPERTVESIRENVEWVKQSNK